MLVLLHEIIWVFPAVKKMAPLYAWSALGAEDLFSFRWGFVSVCHDLHKKSAIAGEAATIRLLVELYKSLVEPSFMTFMVR